MTSSPDLVLVVRGQKKGEGNLNMHTVLFTGFINVNNNYYTAFILY